MGKLIANIFSILLSSVIIKFCSANNIEIKDYCSIYKYENNLGGLRFTKEVITAEYANIQNFKALHCCIRGYRSIEW